MPKNAIRTLILANELAHSRCRLRELIVWLQTIADDFEGFGACVRDLRREIKRLQRELRRRSGGTLLGLLVLSTACASTPEPDRARELAACQLISKSGDDLASCLIMKYSWGADSAAPAKYAWQRELDSIRIEHETDAARAFGRQWVTTMRAELLRFGMSAHNVDSVLRDAIAGTGDPPNVAYLQELGPLLLRNAQLRREIRTLR